MSKVEIYSMEFLKTATVGFPVFPVKIEASEEFSLKNSEFKWELVKKSANDSTENEPVDAWGIGIHSQFVYFPTEETIGSFLRCTCTPSDGHRFGIPAFVDTTSPVEMPTSNLIFEERQKRLDQKKNNSVTRVVSYNCLADKYASPKMLKDSPPECLKIDYRLPLLNKEIFCYDGDIVCVQEIDAQYYEGNYEPFLCLHGHYQGAFGRKSGDANEGVATFFNKSKFSLLHSETVVILEHMKSLPMWESILSKNPALLKRLEGRNQVLQVNILQSKANPNLILVVGNTHLYSRADADHIRLLQTITCAHYLQTKVSGLEADNPGKTVTVIFCGDFNCMPPFSSFRLLTTGSIKGEDKDWQSNENEKLTPGVDFQHNLNLINCNVGGELTNITMQFEGCLDYIFYQPDKIKLLKNYPPPAKSVLAVMSETTADKLSLPNFKTPSDHIPVIADFDLIM